MNFPVCHKVQMNTQFAFNYISSCHNCLPSTVQSLMSGGDRILELLKIIIMICASIPHPYNNLKVLVVDMLAMFLCTVLH